jgi:hypothetical protein
MWDAVRCEGAARVVAVERLKRLGYAARLSLSHEGGPRGALVVSNPSLVGQLSSSAGELNVKDPRLKISPGFPNHRAISLFA